MNAWSWRLRQWARRLGIPGLLGLGALIAALAFWLGSVRPLQQTALAQEAELRQLKRAAATRPPPPVAFNPLASLPRAGEAAQLIGELERLARLHGIELPRGQYSVATLDGTSMQHWRLVLPLETDYPTLHAFVATALERLPSMVLDGLKLKREQIESTELQAELRMSLFIESAP